MTDMAVYLDESKTTLLSHSQYVYDVFDRRIAKYLDTDGDTVVDTTDRFIYEDTLSALCSTVPCSLSTVPSPSHIALVFDDDSLTHRYLHGPAIDMVLSDEAFDPATGALDEIFWALADHQGTIRDVVSFNAANDTTFLEQHLIIDTFGNIKEEAVPIIRFVFTAREYDPESGLYYYRARYYDSVSGRFISQDPIGFAGGDKNLYRYVANNVLNATDPTGLAGPKGKAVGYVVRRVGREFIKVQVLFTEKQAARLFLGKCARDGLDILVREGRQQAHKIAKIVNDLSKGSGGKILEGGSHLGHQIRNRIGEAIGTGAPGEEKGEEKGTFYFSGEEKGTFYFSELSVALDQKRLVEFGKWMVTIGHFCAFSMRTRLE